MNETVNQVTGGTAEQQTFSQEEVNKIVGERLAREREKYSDYDVLKKKAAAFDEAEEAQKSELQKEKDRALALEAELNGLKKKDEVRLIRESVAKESGVPAHLLTGETEEECKSQAEAIQKYAHPDGYPQVRDGGEATHSNTQGGSTRQQFADFMGQNLF